MESTFFLPRAGGHGLHCVLTHPAEGGTPGERALVIVCHGFTGSKTADGRLLVAAARDLAAHGIAALRFDFFGSGDSEGEFSEMSLATEIEDVKQVVVWAKEAHGATARLGLLGHSLGGAVALCAADELRDPAIRAWVGWCTVPGFAAWQQSSVGAAAVAGMLDLENPLRVGPQFFTDRPARDVPAAFCALRDVARLQVQGDRDREGFLAGFREIFSESVGGTKRHIVIQGADHCFTRQSHRQAAIAATTAWFQEHLGAGSHVGGLSPSWE